ncbi:proprotein convertase P-domain-containing protein [Actinomycetospora cinnamomea]|uniref:Proprotein convertase P-domain-containing protein n=1 Tax=Actinomycetospora cinnamomea TaxID=663609 RepID=A0A2U1FIT1_9PSEU|nr:proprotein convertase P-domain-containing protein [Actinomycetospora cinnamomea]PVZ12061.1 proprotein convertase P-domain-containing protein [Actinomycetospora cinnamomea]
MSTSTPPSASSGSEDPAARPTAVVGQVPESAQHTAVVGQVPGAGAPTAYGPVGPPGYPPSGYDQAAYAAPRYTDATVPAPYAGYGPGRPPTGGMPYAGYGAPAPAPRKRGWIAWLIGGIALVLVAGVVAAYLLLSGGGTFIGVSSNRVAIPDASTSGVTDTVVLDGSGTVQNVHLEASITHPYTCDLTVRLISPQGTQVTVADPTECTRSNPNLPVNLDGSTAGSPLAAFVGEEAGGEWRLQVIDSVGIDQGTLTGWGLTVQAG